MLLADAERAMGERRWATASSAAVISASMAHAGWAVGDMASPRGEPDVTPCGRTLEGRSRASGVPRDDTWWRVTQREISKRQTYGQSGAQACGGGGASTLIKQTKRHPWWSGCYTSQQRTYTCARR